MYFIFALTTDFWSIESEIQFTINISSKLNNMHLNIDECHIIETLSSNVITFVIEHCPLAHTNGFNGSKTSKSNVTLKKN